jgi:hypothetical protein
MAWQWQLAMAAWNQQRRRGGVSASRKYQLARRGSIK